MINSPSTKERKKMSEAVEKIFDDLDNFRNFCRDYGYRYNEKDLYNWKSYAWQQYSKFSSGKSAKDMWEQDRKRFA